MTYYVGQDVKVTLTATGDGDAPANPSSVRFKVKPPSGAVVTYTLGTSPNVTTVTAGKVYALTFDCTSAGAWFVKAETLDGSATVIGVTEVKLLVSATKVT